MEKTPDVDKELDEARKADPTAFRCVECLKLSNGFGIRIGYGWVCSDECHKNHRQRWLSGELK